MYVGVIGNVLPEVAQVAPLSVEVAMAFDAGFMPMILFPLNAKIQEPVLGNVIVDHVAP